MKLSRHLIFVLLPYGLGSLLTAFALGWSPVDYALTGFGNVRERVRGSAKKAVDEYIASHPVRKLQIGAGPNSLPGWLNSDIEPQKDQIYLDAAAVYPIPSESFDYIFAEQLIEHLSLEQGQTMLREWRRILRPGGKIRIATPDLTTFAKLFTEEDRAEPPLFAAAGSGFEALNPAHSRV
jgi:SAM-dependent methyltransferase